MLKIIKAEFCRYCTELVNYYPDQIVDILVKYILFCAFLGTQAEGGDPVFLWSYLYWIFASTVISEMSIAMSSEKQIGSIEHLMIMPSSITSIMIIRTYVVFCLGLVRGVVLAALVCITLSYPVTFSISIVGVYLISIIGFTGLGLLLTGLTLKFAKVASFEQLLSYGLLLLTGVITAAPAAGNGIIWRYFPYSMGVKMLHQGIESTILPTSWLILAAGNIIVLLIGLIVFRSFLYMAKSEGVVAQY